jgi:cell division protein FtsB
MRNRTKGEVEQRRILLKRLFCAMALIANGYLLLSLLFGEMGLLKFMKMKQTHAQIRKENQDLQEENEALGRRIKMLKTDPNAIEQIARDRLGLAKEGELIYEFYD